jgi:HAD superfamily hydrolase (TIGR01450 family)
MIWVLDLDGVVWLGDTPIPGSLAAIDRLRATSERVLFLTNNSSLTVEAYIEKMAGIGLRCEPGDLCTAAQAGAALVEPGETVLVCGGPGTTQAVEARGARAVRDVEPGIDAVMVGWHRDFDFGRLTAAFRAVHQGARLIGTNDDPTYPTADGPLPGGGSIVAAVAYASGVTPLFGGKPNEPAAQLVFERLGWPASPSIELRRTITMVGDRPSTDGGMARRLGGRFALVLSGVTQLADLPVTPAPDVVADNLSDLVHNHSEGFVRY